MFDFFIIMHILENYPLKQINTFGIDVKTKYLTYLTDNTQIPQLLSHKIFNENPQLYLGGGSNVLFVNDFQGIVVKIATKGIELISKSNNNVLIKAMAGEDWEEFVDFCVSKGFGGLENLTMIPGNVGTSPMQNIGAYGVELKDCFHSLEACETQTGKIRIFSKEECDFGYRESFFKKEGKGQYIILSVTFCLSLNNHVLKMEYGSIADQLKSMGIIEPQIQDIKNAVKSIRESKIPDPATLGNAGSFFKNPVIPKDMFQHILTQYPEIPHFENNPYFIKIPAAWLIEKAGWKGYRRGDTGVHQNQALVLVNHGNAKGHEILALSEQILQSVKQKFGITLEREINVVGN